MQYHIAYLRGGYWVLQLGLDQHLHPIHPDPMQSVEAAERLRADLESGCFDPPPDPDYPAYGDRLARDYETRFSPARNVVQFPQRKAPPVQPDWLDSELPPF